MKVLITTSTFGVYGDAPLRLLEKNGFQPVLNPHKRKIQAEELRVLLEQHHPVALLAGTEKVGREALKASSGFLRVISRVGVGMDNVDVDAAKEFGVKVFRTADAPTAAVAELTVGLMLAVLRKIARADREIRQGKWSPLMGALLCRKTVGMAGVGRIGSAVSKILLKGFGARVIGYDPHLSEEQWERSGVDWVTSFELLLEKSDIVTLHLPLSGSGAVIGAREMQRMKKGAILINTSRGGLVDEMALCQALASGHLGGAGLDVFEKEPYAGPLTDCETVVATMHMGSYAAESRIQMEMEAVENFLVGIREE